MNEIHVVHKRIGGVGHIAKLLEQQGHVVVLPDAKKVAAFAKDKNVGRIFFHQPLSHLYCLVIVLFNPRLRLKMSCVLHESSHYNIGAAKYFRARLAYLVRLVVIRMSSLIGVEILGVSEYVCASYFLKNKKTIHFLNLFREDLERASTEVTLKEDLAVVWLRKGTAAQTAFCLTNLKLSGCLSGVVLLGDADEVATVTKRILTDRKLQGVPILNDRPSLKQEEFYTYLCRARWFLSFFAREGFGLSAFQATFFGCIVLAAWSGAIVEWLPVENKKFLDLLASGTLTPDNAEVSRVSAINMKFAREHFYNEN